MIKRFFILSLGAVLLIFLAKMALAFYPEFVYNRLLKGKQHRWFNLGPLRSEWLSPNRKFSEGPSQTLTWESFHFFDYKLPLPRYGSEYKVGLLFESAGAYPLKGLQLLGLQGTVLLELEFRPSFTLNLYPRGQKLYQIPLVKKGLLAKSNESIWQDLFQHDLKEEPLTLERRFYNLYLLDLRKKLLGDSAQSFAFLAGPNLGLVVKQQEWHFYWWKNERLYPFVWRLVKNDAETQELLLSLVYQMSYQQGIKSDADIISNQLGQLPLHDQFGERGFFYLLSAWTQDLERTYLLKEAVARLEQGRGDPALLSSLYRYIDEAYGQDFFKSPNRKLWLEEVEKEIVEKHEDSKSELQDRLEYFLEQAKNKEKDQQSKLIGR